MIGVDMSIVHCSGGSLMGNIGLLKAVMTSGSQLGGFGNYLCWREDDQIRL